MIHCRRCSNKRARAGLLQGGWMWLTPMLGALNWQLSLKRQGDWDQAVATWAHAVAHGTAHRLYPYLELAKYYEHRARVFCDAVAALAEQAGTSLEGRP